MRPAPAEATARQPLIDALKVGAAQLIVLHHLAFYGPMSEHAAVLAPALLAWLADPARQAVQVFLVVGGALAARGLAPGGRLAPGGPSLPRRLLLRYLRLGWPLAVTLMLALACAALARRLADLDHVPDAAELGEILIHLLMLQDLLGVEALSAGVWYAAIDVQLYALLLAALGLGAKLDAAWAARAPAGAWRPASAPLLMAAGTLASLLVFNRDSDGDVAAPYFLGAYGLGVLAAWWGPGLRASWRRQLGLGLLAGGVALALWLDFRSRLALAAAVALLLVLAPALRRLADRAWRHAGAGLARGHRLGRGLAAQAGASYALFLVHYPVLMLVGAVFDRWVPDHAARGHALGLLAAWGLSVALAALFHRHVELPGLRWIGRHLAGPSRQPA